VRSDLTPKPWAKSFAKYAADLAALPQPTPKLPTFDVATSLTTPAEELKPMHDKYTQMIRAAVASQK
jgi:hypothetical protein